MQKKAKSKKKKSKFSFLYRFFIKMALIAGATYLLLVFVLAFHRESGNGMFPAVKDGDGCIFYKLEEYMPNDVVLYKTETGERRTGRIIATGGQTVDFLEAGGFTVNGYEPTEEIMYQTYRDEESEIIYPLEIEENSFFIMNDFRSDTKDSRLYGSIKKSQIEGKMIFILRRRSF